MTRLPALSLAVAALLAGMSAAAAGGLALAAALGSPGAPQSAPDAETVRHVLIPAGGRGEAEAAALDRLVEVLDAEGVRLRTGAFRTTAEARRVTLAFEVEARPTAIWRALHALETGSPALVLTRVRAVSREGGALISVSADAVGVWAPASPETGPAQSAPPQAGAAP